MNSFRFFIFYVRIYQNRVCLVNSYWFFNENSALIFKITKWIIFEKHFKNSGYVTLKKNRFSQKLILSIICCNLFMILINKSPLY